MTREKVRIRFRKAGDLRFLSHHDLMRAFERMLRRSGLPFRSTEGFHPLPRMTFAAALALGIVGRQEVVDIEFDGPLAVEDVQHRLAAQAPPGLEILSVCAIDPKRGAQVCRAEYFFPVEAAQHPQLPERIAGLLGQDACWVERVKPQPRRFNVRPFVRGLSLEPHGLVIDLHVTPQGSARPEEVLQLLGLKELFLDGSVLERTALELEDEPTTSLVPPIPAGSRPAMKPPQDERLLTTDFSKEPYEERNAD
jgi:radical SAM-linked protein